MGHVTLSAQQRTEFGNGPTRRLRRQGLVPGIVYQPGGASLAFALDDRELRRALAEGARTGVIDLTVGDQPARPVLLRDWQLDAIRGNVLHLDFQEVDLTQEVQTSVAITLVGNPVGVRDGGVLDQPLREVLVSALPDNLPDHVELDVEALEIGSSIAVGQIVAPEGVTIDSDPELVVASVVAPSAVIVEEDEGEEGLEGEEGVAGEEAPAETEEPAGDESSEG